MIADEFPSQGSERHLSNEGRTQMAGGNVVALPINKSMEDSMKGAAAQAANERAFREVKSGAKGMNITNVSDAFLRKKLGK